MSELICYQITKTTKIVLKLKYSEGYKNGPFMVKSMKTAYFLPFSNQTVLITGLLQKGSIHLLKFIKRFIKLMNQSSEVRRLNNLLNCSKHTNMTMFHAPSLIKFGVNL